MQEAGEMVAQMEHDTATISALQAARRVDERCFRPVLYPVLTLLDPAAPRCNAVSPCGNPVFALAGAGWSLI